MQGQRQERGPVKGTVAQRSAAVPNHLAPPESRRQNRFDDMGIVGNAELVGDACIVRWRLRLFAAAMIRDYAKEEGGSSWLPARKKAPEVI